MQGVSALYHWSILHVSCSIISSYKHLLFQRSLPLAHWMTAVTYVPFTGSLERLSGRVRQTAKEVLCQRRTVMLPYQDLPGYSQECSQFRRPLAENPSPLGLEIDEALFLAGAPKGPISVKIRPHIFFDDHMFHIEGAQKFGTITAHVPYGINQKENNQGWEGEIKQ